MDSQDSCHYCVTSRASFHKSPEKGGAFLAALARLPIPSSSKSTPRAAQLCNEQASFFSSIQGHTWLLLLSLYKHPKPGPSQLCSVWSVSE